MKRLRLLTIMASTVSVIGLAIGPSAASPGPQAAQAAPLAVCQPANRAFQYVSVASNGHLAVWHRECNGEYPLNSLGYIIQTRGWNGCVYTTTGRIIPFTPNRDIFIQDRVFHITLFDTGPPVCVDPAPNPG